LFGLKFLDISVAIQSVERILSKDRAWNVREAAVSALGRLGDPKAAAMIKPYLEDPEPFMRLAALNALAALGIEDIKEVAIRMLNTHDVPCSLDNRRAHSKTIAELTRASLKDSPSALLRALSE